MMYSTLRALHDERSIAVKVKLYVPSVLIALTSVVSCWLLCCKTYYGYLLYQYSKFMDKKQGVSNLLSQKALEMRTVLFMGLSKREDIIKKCSQKKNIKSLSSKKV